MGCLRRCDMAVPLPSSQKPKPLRDCTPRSAQNALSSPNDTWSRHSFNKSSHPPPASGVPS